MAEEKQQNKETVDINTRERHHHRRSGLFGGLVLILLGISLFIATQGWVSWANWWQYFIIGLGVILILDAFIRSFDPERHSGLIARLISGLVLICIGLAFVFGLSNWWPIILIAVGIAIIIGGFTKKR